MKKLLHRAAAILVLCLVGFFACGFTELPSPLLLGEDNAFSRVVLEQLTDYELKPISRQQDSSLFSSEEKENLAVCLDVQAAPALKYGIGKKFSPQSLVTVVFAVHPDQTDFRPETWKELLSSPDPVKLPTSTFQQRLILGAAAYGLDGEEYSERIPLLGFEALADRGCLYCYSSSCPIEICLDTDAVQRILQGENLQIMVPQDGTLSFYLGLLGQEQKISISPEKLLNAGFRLPDGRTLGLGYPPEEAYSAAVPVPDTDHFLQVTKDTTRDLRRSVFHTRYLNSGDGRESTMLFSAACLLVLFWAASGLHRSSSREMRRWFWLIAGQMIGWILLCLFKYLMPSRSVYARFSWYGYYIFLMGLPLTMLYIGTVVDRMPHQGSLPEWFQALAWCYPVFVILVFSNDLHNLVFQFDLEGDWGSDYTAGIVYYFIFGYCILCFTLSLFLLIQKSRKSPKRWGSLGPILVALLLIGYNTAYTLGVPFIRASNLTLFFCFFSILYVEALLHAGLIPTNRKYQELFSSSPLNMQILDSMGRTALRSAGALELTQAQRDRILSQPQTPFYQDPNTLLHSQMIHGGTAIWQEDVKELRDLQEKLSISIQNLKATNALLHKESQIRKQKVNSEVKNQLFEQLEQEIETETEELSSVIRNLPRAEDRGMQISYIPLLLCHLKRRCNLFFLSQEGHDISSNEIAVYLDELSEFAAYGQIHALVRFGISGPLPVSWGTLCYDFYFQLISWAVRKSHAVLIGQIERHGNRLCFDVLSSQSTENLILEETFLRKVRNAGGGISQHMVEEMQGIYLIFEEAVP